MGFEKRNQDGSMTIQLFSPSTDHRELAALTRVLDTHWLGKGARVTEFEAAWAMHVGVPVENMVSTNSCTSALFEAVRLAGIGVGDEVIIPTIHFVGTAQAVIAAGGTPVFCDVDRWTMNATRETIEAKLTEKTKAVIMNHYGGNIARFSRTDLADLMWIDDLANAPMIRISDLGTCDYATWSMDSMKVLTTGDGGFLYCVDWIDSAQARMDFCLGVDSESGISNQKSSRWWEFSVPFPGQGRHLMNDLVASIGLEQLKKLDGFIARRREICLQYAALVQELPEISGYQYGDYFAWIYTERRDELARHLRENGVYTSYRYFPLHLAYNTGDKLPDAEWAAEHSLLLPLHNNLTDADVEYVCEKVKEFFDGR
jgi:aminotransferase